MLYVVTLRIRKQLRFLFSCWFPLIHVEVDMIHLTLKEEIKELDDETEVYFASLIIMF